MPTRPSRWQRAVVRLASGQVMIRSCSGADGAKGTQLAFSRKRMTVGMVNLL
jgi:hypothetical protein